MAMVASTGASILWIVKLIDNFSNDRNDILKHHLAVSPRSITAWTSCTRRVNRRVIRRVLNLRRQRSTSATRISILIQPVMVVGAHDVGIQHRGVEFEQSLSENHRRVIEFVIQTRVVRRSVITDMPAAQIVRTQQRRR